MRWWIVFTLLLAGCENNQRLPAPQQVASPRKFSGDIANGLPRAISNVTPERVRQALANRGYDFKGTLNHDKDSGFNVTFTMQAHGFAYCVRVVGTEFPEATSVIAWVDGIKGNKEAQELFKVIVSLLFTDSFTDFTDSFTDSANQDEPAKDVVDWIEDWNGKTEHEYFGDLKFSLQTNWDVPNKRWQLNVHSSR